MTTREVEIEAEPIDAYESVCGVLENATAGSAFRVLLDEQSHRYSIGWSDCMAGSRSEELAEQRAPVQRPSPVPFADHRAATL